ncbi:MAG: 50S ribosomal protein L3 [Nitrospinae bacterium RIFCSPLOWO2_12_FULL_45_22]|uniref:Large ribosomal subunit protein uL3 n=1 Tax=uncultured bacterium Rifle_16ft_4_minimus_4226 TaxID=1665160 RepID=A0A0H4TTH2_9BACT|nr:50S ribosomal protein L3, large subunit ribosomal protein L3 [uncultured bacterium Rifle_16ft_4_minimus_4226]OGW14976.1 MAG: 50S ribosomal protein L3 [Nitrospinae bacterium RIFCSPLOWO2_12_FULL_45_22]
MIKGLLGKKLGMTQWFTKNGEVLPVTIVEVGPCWVIQKKTPEKDGYEAAQIGYLPRKAKRTTKPLQGQLKKAGVKPVRFLREVPSENFQELALGQNIGVEIFSQGAMVDVTGTSKGRGFAGVMKRHGFAGAPGGHGTHESFRGPGSIGSAAYPGRVFKGKKLPGRMGGSRVTVQNLEIIKVIKEHNTLVLKGAVPGPNGGLLLIRKSKKVEARERARQANEG